MEYVIAADAEKRRRMNMDDMPEEIWANGGTCHWVREWADCTETKYIRSDKHQQLKECRDMWAKVSQDIGAAYSGRCSIIKNQQRAINDLAAALEEIVDKVNTTNLVNHVISAKQILEKQKEFIE